jgi:hypothetical protein
MDEKDHEIAHFRRPGKRPKTRQIAANLAIRHGQDEVQRITELVNRYLLLPLESVTTVGQGRRLTPVIQGHR